MTEKWKAIPGYKEYEASNYGRIRRIHLLQLKPHLHGKRGYPHVMLCKGPRSHKHYFVHNLILLTFIGPKPHGYVTNHRDANRKNNHLLNLHYVTKRENYDHAIKLGLYLRGNQLPHAKLSPEKVRRIRRWHKSRISCFEIARRLHVTPWIIYPVVKGKTWKHVI